MEYEIAAKILVYGLTGVVIGAITAWVILGD